MTRCTYFCSNKPFHSLRAVCPLVDAWSVAFSPDSKHIATGSHHGKVNIFGVESGKKEYSLDTRGKFILSIAYVRSSIVFFCQFKCFTVSYDANEALINNPFNHWSTPQSPDGKYLASGAIDGIINIFDIATGKLLHTLEGELGISNEVIFRAPWPKPTINTTGNNAKFKITGFFPRVKGGDLMQADCFPSVQVTPCPSDPSLSPPTPSCWSPPPTTVTSKYMMCELSWKLVDWLLPNGTTCVSRGNVLLQKCKESSKIYRGFSFTGNMLTWLARWVDTGPGFLMWPSPQTTPTLFQGKTCKTAVWRNKRH